MKKILVVLISMVVISMSTAAQDKKPSFGVKAGLNLSIFSASINSEFNEFNPAPTPDGSLRLYSQMLSPVRASTAWM